MKENYNNLLKSSIIRAVLITVTIAALSLSIPVNSGVFKFIFFIITSISLAMGIHISYLIVDGNRKTMHALMILIPIEALIIVTRQTYLFSIISSLILIAFDSLTAFFAQPLLDMNASCKTKENVSEIHQNHQKPHIPAELSDDFNEITSKNVSEIEEPDDVTLELEPIKKDTKIKMSDILNSKYIDSFKKEQD